MPFVDPEEFSGGLYPVFTERPEGDIGLGPSAPGPRAWFANNGQEVIRITEILTPADLLGRHWKAPY